MLEPFVTDSQLKAIASISDSVEASFVFPYLIVAQDMGTVPIIGLALAQEISDQLASGNTLSAANQYLMDNYVIKYQCYKAWELSAPFLPFRAYKKSYVKPAVDGAEALVLDEIRFIKANITGMMNHYQKALFEFLENDALSAAPIYPLYRTSQTNEFRSEGSPTTGFYFKTKVNRLTDTDYH